VPSEVSANTSDGMSVFFLLQSIFVPKEVSFKTLADDFPFTYHFYNRNPKWEDLSMEDKTLIQLIATEGIFDIDYTHIGLGCSVHHPLKSC